MKHRNILFFGYSTLQSSINFLSPALYRAQRAKIGYLEYDYGGKREGNIGGKIIMDTVRQGGYSIEACTPAHAQ